MTSSRITVLYGWRTVAAVVMAAGALGAWLWLRTPTREGFAYHSLGASDGAPTVILLHGYGAPGDDLVRFGETVVDGVDGIRVLCVEGPHDVGLGGHAWFGGPQTRRATRERLVRFVESVVADGTPRSRIVIGGFSQGAAAAADVAAAMGDLRGVAILSGDHSTLEPLTGRVFVSHGRGDTVLSFYVAERRARTYAEHAEVRFVPFDGGHTLRPVEPAFVQWLRETFARSR